MSNVTKWSVFQNPVTYIATLNSYTSPMARLKWSAFLDVSLAWLYGQDHLWATGHLARFFLLPPPS